MTVRTFSRYLKGIEDAQNAEEKAGHAVRRVVIRRGVGTNAKRWVDEEALRVYELRAPGAPVDPLLTSYLRGFITEAPKLQQSILDLAREVVELRRRLKKLEAKVGQE
jgi:hypothetical protein